MFESLLIVNRGEIACRIIATARRLGVRTIAVYSEPDTAARHVRMADDARCIGPASAVDSYLRIDRVIDAALDAGAAAIHPGYGFLSENADFAQACADAGLIFVGPPVEAIRAMGSKSVAKDLMERAGVPVVPDYRGKDQSPEAFAREIAAFGYPVMLKPAHGGGGKGMGRVESAADLAEALKAAQRVARAAFGHDEVLAEKYIARPRHVEVQVFGDSDGNVVHLFERDCTLQRRHQKIIEEAPASSLPVDLRKELQAAAVRAARAVEYRNAGTVEFLVDMEGGFYFMEMNTRLQVEHPVTERLTGIDLVAWQLRVAVGEPLPLTQAEIGASGHAIEARVYAEAPDKGFLPSPGRISALAVSDVGGARLDSGVERGDMVEPYYDPMIAKIIVHEEDREQARRALLATLAETRLEGPDTNLAFLATLLSNRAFREGSIDVQFVDRELASLLPPDQAPSGFAIAAAMAFLREPDVASDGDPWSDASGWRLNMPTSGYLTVAVAGKPHTAIWHEIRGQEADRLVWENHDWPVRVIRNGRHVAVDVDGRRGEALVLSAGAALYIITGEAVERVDVVDPLQPVATSEGSTGAVVAPILGKLTEVTVSVGQTVAKGDRLAIVEAMKMEHVLRATLDGKVIAVQQQTGAFVEEGALLVEIEPRAQ